MLGIRAFIETPRWFKAFDNLASTRPCVENRVSAPNYAGACSVARVNLQPPPQKSAGFAKL
jgi:hypothetical protein